MQWGYCAPRLPLSKKQALGGGAQPLLNPENGYLPEALYQLPVGCILLGSDGKMEFLNQEAEELFGYSADELRGGDPADLLVPHGERARFVSLVSEAAQKDKAMQFIKGQTKVGDELVCKWQSKLIRSASREARVLITVKDVSGEKNIESQLNRQLRYLRALQTIDLTISGSMDIRPILQVVLREAMEQLQMSAAVILTFDPSLNLLKFAAGRGLRTSALEATSLHIGMGYAGKAALERKIVQVPDLSPRKTDFLHMPGFENEGFKSYYCVPLISKGTIQGVLESFHRDPFIPDPEWLGFFEMLGGQAAIAMEGAKVFSDLQKSHLELSVAYDATLEGWSRALDLRDRDTEGHTQRVADLTDQLAKAMDIGKAERVNLRRGALLHDIGKLGIPDRILLKQEKLTQDEWAVIRQHPTLAYEMLKPIGYLSASLDIPYCHHERWDGHGYPRGLKGEQIPLGARIFAVVDVFDALTSDRPYRHAWPVQQALDYLREERGKRFDPAVLDAFLGFMENRKNR
jgi:PAS domain S-box-containing protein/putative nucleotidyltransferase with HDIG domain